MSDHPLHGTASRRHPRRRRQPDSRDARIAALREARLHGELVIDRDRIARRMLG
ncbi:MAG: flagellar biosynthesis anti-sigma factor FlgM [Gammaproteobacteria bacterium]|nr:flagellar biosynthesis anti-sigma factor FlgM [Gammaproteobacteria bacterium]